ncbi:MAG TPA: COX15/CtaA family protein [Candidatus Dormibacteraeota bacterium]|nr:COX15/CtaA family protein [Candidatus Dormibacteraeota bacterium]
MLNPAFFRRLAFVTAFFAYLQIALGGIVRVSGSGLGCPDWPLCNGRPYPPANIHSIIEYSHRTVGTITGVLLIATVVLAWLIYRQRRPVVAWVATGSLLAIAIEGGLGGVVVANELQPWLVLVHLGLAMLILGSLVATAVLSMRASQGSRDRGFTRLAVAGVVATFVMLLTGSAVVASRADETCHSWVLCGDPFSLLHRGTVLLVGALIIFVLVRAMRKPDLRTSALATLGVMLLQVAVGAGAALTDGAFFNGLHVAIATLVWAGMLSVLLLTLPRTDHEPELTPVAVKRHAA